MFSIKVNAEEYEKIINKIKVYEYAIDKDMDIFVGDYILFQKRPDFFDAVLTKVIDKKKFVDFEEMAKYMSFKELGFEGFTKSEVIDFCNKKFDADLVKQHGVVVFKYEISK